jgi:hypothetical protein
VPDVMVQENLSVPAAIASGVATAIGTVRDAVNRYMNSGSTNGPRRSGMGRGGGHSGGSGRGGSSRWMNKRNKRKR